ncbi:DUF2570 domain-containing protein [Escherichia coli]|uniref:DUF2570 domain-containing protein n=1 Tax=Escherichia coli TaxID=562 RepID=UPI0018678F62|nr:DUF2570 domain-containing protein [Escherichia coli]EJI1308664.1 DUF2570 domain-containing protein [Escherichia coli]EKE0200424.1 DUF2570 domain-containing protein [Escherichia coli]EMB0577874.1 DUF2570 domain-containing protein [Escherichia coli]MBE3610683.1 DUF2570 domain-containing protein [Escherichia coli]MBE3620845.1 DUF2570 domain-containing protein [Escherichia coli]
MKIHYKIIIFSFALSVLGGIVWSASYYHDKYQAERLRADAAEQNANAAGAITANVIRSVNIINVISEANQHAKQQIALESQRTQEDIKVAVADDDCASRPVPAAAADRLRKYANSLRPGSGSSVTSQPDG